MADQDWHASGTILAFVQALACLACTVAPARTLALSDDFVPQSYPGRLDPNLVWEALLGGIALCSFLAAIVLWIHSALQRARRRTQLWRNAFVSSALNNLDQGVVMTDAQARIIFCNDRYLEIYGLARSDLWSAMTGRYTLFRIMR